MKNCRVTQLLRIDKAYAHSQTIQEHIEEDFSYVTFRERNLRFSVCTSANLLKLPMF